MPPDTAVSPSNIVALDRNYADLPAPLTPPDADLRAGLRYVQLDIHRLFDSDFFAIATGAEFKAGVALWCKSLTQVPAGSLPVDDRVLAHLSYTGQELWPRIKEVALHGWMLCSDGRLYHKVVAEKVCAVLRLRATKSNNVRKRWEQAASRKVERLKKAAEKQGVVKEIRPYNVRAKCTSKSQIEIQESKKETPSESYVPSALGAADADACVDVEGEAISAEQRGSAPTPSEHSPSSAPTPGEAGGAIMPTATERQCMDAWNAQARAHGLTLVHRLTVARQRHLRARIKDLGGVAGFIGAMAEVEHSSLWKGLVTNKDGRPPWRPCFDDALSPAKCMKLSEGAYADGAKRAGMGKLGWVAERNMRLQEQLKGIG